MNPLSGLYAALLQGRQVAAVFAQAGPPADVGARKIAGSPALREVFDNVLCAGMHDLQVALSDPDVSFARNRRVVRAGRVTGWLDRRQFEELNRLVDRVEQLMMSGQPGPGRNACTFGCVVAPLGSRPTRKEKNG